MTINSADEQQKTEQAVRHASKKYFNMTYLWLRDLVKVDGNYDILYRKYNTIHRNYNYT
jgi:hypothetical protein